MNVPTCGSAAPTTATPGAGAATDATSSGDLFASLVGALTAALPGTGQAQARGGRSADPGTEDDATGSGSSVEPESSPGAGSSVPAALTALLAAAAQAGALGIVSTSAPAAGAAPSTGPGSPSVGVENAATAPDAAAGVPATTGRQLPIDRTGTLNSTEGPLAAAGAEVRSARATARLTDRFGAGTTDAEADGKSTGTSGAGATSGHAPATGLLGATAPSTTSGPATAPDDPASSLAIASTTTPTGPGGVPGPVIGLPAATGVHAGRGRPGGEPDDAARRTDAPAADVAGVQNPRPDGAERADGVAAGTFLTTRGNIPDHSTGEVAVGRQVAEAVGDNVARLVSRGNGTHRLTLQLQPAALGDVKVVLTVRAGQVHVSLAAGDAARAALLRDAPELHRLLTRAGADQPQIVVRELPAAAGALPTASAQPAGTATDQSNAGPATGQPTSGHQGAQLGPDTGGQSQDRRAWTPAATSARDGGQQGPGRHDPDRPIDPGTRVRTAGVDVTM